MEDITSAGNDIVYLGVTDWRHYRQRFGIRDSDRAFHTHVCGKTGCGKSTLLLNMAIQDIQRGKGVAIFDAHGDLSEHLLNYIPADRIEHVVYFNATDSDFPIAFNPLANVDQKYHHLVASGLISTIKKMFADSWGPRLEYIMRFSLLTLLAYGQATLLDIQPLLTDQHFRERVLRKVTNPRLQAFWKNEHNKTGAGFRTEAISPILNKVGLFTSSIPLRNTFGQVQGNFTMQEIMDSGKILIVNLSKGIIGEDACTMIGGVLVTAMQNAALFRATQPEHKRRPFYAYIDEFQSFATLSFCDALSESRKFGLSLFLSHQFLEQLEPQVRASIFGNVGTLLVFRVGSADARHYTKEFDPVFENSDFINLPKYSFYLRLMIDGLASKPFSAKSQPLPEVTLPYKDEIIARSRNKYAQPKELVEKEILYTVEPKSNGNTLF